MNLVQEPGSDLIVIFDQATTSNLDRRIKSDTRGVELRLWRAL